MPVEISVELALLSVTVAISAITISSAIEGHMQALRDVHQSHSPVVPVNDATWPIIVAQLAADGLKEAVDICAFSSMQVLTEPGLVAWIRFVLRDGRVLVFATRCRVPGCKGRGRRFDTQRYPHMAYELQQVWMYFMAASGQAAPVPRDASWYVLPLQNPQERSGRAIVLRSHQAYQPRLIHRLQRLIAPARR